MLTVLLLMQTLVPLALLHHVSDSLTGEDSLLVCDLLSHTSPGSQSISALPSSSPCSSVAPSGSCLEERAPGQTASGKTCSYVSLGVLATQLKTDAIRGF